MQNNLTNNICILVVSCDSYKDLQKPFWSSFDLFWKDCPFEIYYLSNTTHPKYSKAKPLLVGEDVGWSKNLKKALESLPHQYVFLWLDDLLLKEKIHTERIEQVFQNALEKQVNFLGLSGKPQGSVFVDQYMGEITPGSLYRVSTVLSLWNRGFLQEFLDEKESAWEFEINGSYRSDIFPRFYSTHKQEIAVHNAVIRGKWRRSVLRSLKKNKIEVDMHSRKVFSWKEEFVFFLKTIRTKVLFLFPKSCQRSIRNFFKHGI